MFTGNARDIPTVSLAGKKKKQPSKEELAEKSNRDRKQRELEQKRFYAARRIQTRVRIRSAMRAARRLYRTRFDEDRGRENGSIAPLIRLMRQICFFYRPAEDIGDILRLKQLIPVVVRSLLSELPQNNLRAAAEDTLDVVVGSRVYHITKYGFLLNSFAKVLLLHVEALYFSLPQDTVGMDNAVACFKMLLSTPAAADNTVEAANKLNLGTRLLSAVHCQVCLLLRKLICEEAVSSPRAALVEFLSALSTDAIGSLDRPEKKKISVTFCYYYSHNSGSEKTPGRGVSVATASGRRLQCGDSMPAIRCGLCG